MWLLTVTSLNHTHSMKNLFGYRVHVKYYGVPDLDHAGASYALCYDLLF